MSAPAGDPFTEAKTIFLEALQLQEHLYGPDCPEVALTLNYLGIAERELKQYKEAVATHQRALTILEGQYPASEKLLATTHLALAIAYDGLDLSDEPEEHYRKALKLSRLWSGECWSNSRVHPVGTALR